MKKTSVLLCTVVSLLAAGCAKNLKYGTSVSSSDKEKNLLSTLSSSPGDVVGKITVGYQGWATWAMASRQKCFPPMIGRHPTLIAYIMYDCGASPQVCAVAAP
jgi:hypothetical protein